MKKKIIFTFIGGDQRQRDAIYILANEGFHVKVFGFHHIIHENVTIYEQLEMDLFHCDVLMLPIPYNNKHGLMNIQKTDVQITLQSIFEKLNAGTLIILGKADQTFKEYIARYQNPFYDIVEEESFSILNAIPSAEGAIQCAMERTDFTLHESNVLILGYGRIGKVLARMLKAFGAIVTVEARKSEDLAWIREGGYQGVHLNNLEVVLGHQDIIFNTIPSMILDRSKLAKVHSSCVIIDLASYPGGTDFEAANDFGIQASLDLSLPGIVAPKTAAEIICQVTKEIIERHFHYDVMGG